MDARTYELEVEGLRISKATTFDLTALKNFPRVSISATIQCGGNRRSEMGGTKEVGGLAWTGGAIGNAKWTGLRLRDLLKAAGFDPKAYPNPDKIHVQVHQNTDSKLTGLVPVS